MVCDYDRADDAPWQIMNEIQTIGKELSVGELDRAKNKVKSAYLMQLDGSSAVCEDIGRQVLTLQRRMSPAELFMRVDAVTVDDVKRVCDNYLNDVDPVVAAHGPVKLFPDYNYIRRWTYWGRW
jgi:processing peptidase subunit beta